MTAIFCFLSKQEMVAMADVCIFITDRWELSKRRPLWAMELKRPPMGGVVLVRFPRERKENTWGDMFPIIGDARKSRFQVSSAIIFSYIP